MPTYLAGDVRSIQEFIFASPRLLEMRGGSALIRFFDDAVVEALVERFGGEHVFSGGGNFLAVFGDSAEASRGAEECRAALLDAFLDLTGGHGLTIVSHRGSGSFGEALKALHAGLRRAKRSPEGARQLVSMPFLKRCESCGKETADEPMKLPGARGVLQWLGPACARKRRMQAALARSLKAGAPARQPVFGLEADLEVPDLVRRLFGRREAAEEGDEDGAPEATPPAAGRSRSIPPGDFRELTGDDDLAVLKADGNGLGEWFDAVESAEAYRKLSAGIDQALRSSLEGASAAAFGDRAERLLQVLICGGDDLLVALPARFGVRFARTLLAECRFQPPAGGGMAEGRLAAGLLLCKPSFPFRQAHELAEELMRRAKAHCREHGVPSAVDFHRVTATQVQSLEEEREALERGRPGPSSWSYGAAGPYSLEGLSSLLDLAARLRKVSPSQRSRLREILSPRDDGPETPLDQDWQVPARVIAELRTWLGRQEGESPFDLDRMALLWSKDEPSEDGRLRPLHRWLLADALVLAGFPEA